MDEIESLLSRVAERRRAEDRPLVTLTYAQSLDGCIAARPGQPLAVSGPLSLTLTHQLRATHDAILVGIGTVLADNPSLTVRRVEGQHPQPVVVDSQLRCPLDANLLKHHPLPAWIATGESAGRDRQRVLEEAGARVLRLPVDPRGGLNLAALLERLGRLGVTRLMVEGGARLITSFLRQRLADILVLTVSPMLVGGLHAVGDLEETDPARFPRLKSPGCAWRGADLILWGELA